MKKKTLNVLFISLNPREKWTKDKTLIYFPTGLSEVVSETIRNGYHCDLLDLQIESKSYEDIKNLIFTNKYDVVALGALSNNYRTTKKIIELVKESYEEAIIVVGNSVASARPEILLNKTRADVAVIGEGEQTFVEILERIAFDRTLDGIRGIAHRRNGDFVREPSRPAISDLDELGLPKWEFFDVESYIQSASNYDNKRAFEYVKKLRPFPINTTRGCPYRCTFCFNSLYHRENPVRCSSPQLITAKIKKLKNLYRVNFIWFWDENTFFSVKHAAPIIDAMLRENLDIHFKATVRSGFLKPGDEDFAKKLRDAGCRELGYSLESGSPLILKAMNKKTDIRWFYAQKKILDQVGIRSATSIVLGYPQETEETIAETFRICEENDIFPSTGFLLPLPGSIMYNYAIKHGYINDEEEYLMNMGDRQFLNINMTKIPNERLMELTTYHLGRIRDKLGLDIDDEHLICNTVLKR
jgi:radical SAM superfamily enzyme YgiQ (UPF0313 family)